MENLLNREPLHNPHYRDAYLSNSFAVFDFARSLEIQIKLKTASEATSERMAKTLTLCLCCIIPIAPHIPLAFYFEVVDCCLDR